ncbi:MAG: LysR family transcriptional regulator [Lachnospiraceae bacterium]|jgi:DNA-binding transcriptional LysR family regulator
MNTKKLYYLITIEKQGTLSRAAEKLGISQPALTKFLSAAEQSLGAALFTRGGRQLTPTGDGQKVLNFAHQMMDAQDRMMRHIRMVSGLQRTTIRLATAPNRGAMLYSRIYSRFARHFPSVKLDLSEVYASEQAEAVRRGQADIAIGAGDFSDEVEDYIFAREEILVSLPAAHPLAPSDAVRVADLKDSAFLLQASQHSIRRIADRLFREAGFSPMIAFETGNVLLLDSMMQQGIGVGFVSHAHVFPSKDVVYRPLDPPVYQTQHIRYPKGHTLSPAECFLIRLMMEERLSDPRYTPVHSDRLDAFQSVLLAAPDRDTSSPAPETGTKTAVHPQDIYFDTEVMRYILGIVEEGSLTKAADRFYLSQPALSRCLRSVELLIGTPLFSRSHNRLTPTNAGIVFANNAKNILDMEDAFNEAWQKARLKI